MLIVKASEARGYESPSLAAEVVDVYRANNGDTFALEEVPGTHHVHLNQPEVVMEPIKSFLERNKTSSL